MDFVELNTAYATGARADSARFSDAPRQKPWAIARSARRNSRSETGGFIRDLADRGGAGCKADCRRDRRGKIFWPELSTETPFEATDAKAAAHRLHARSLPHRVANHVEFGLIIDRLLDPPIFFSLPDRLLQCDHPLRFDPIGAAGSGVDTAINAIPAFGE